MLTIQALASLALRVALALPFWLAGLTRWEGFLRLRPEALDFFMSGYRADLGGEVYALPAGSTAAMIIASAEIILPAALVLGFATRLSALGILILFVVGGYFTIQGAIGLGRQQNYMPEQPIFYSHKVHAGVNQINWPGSSLDLTQ